MKPPWILHNYPIITHESMYHTTVIWGGQHRRKLSLDLRMRGTLVGLSLSPETSGRIGPHRRSNAWGAPGGHDTPPPEASLSATIPAVVEELFPDDFQTVETEERRFPGLDEQTRSISH